MGVAVAIGLVGVLDDTTLTVEGLPLLKSIDFIVEGAIEASLQNKL